MTSRSLRIGATTAQIALPPPARSASVISSIGLPLRSRRALFAVAVPASAKLSPPGAGSSRYTSDHRDSVTES